MEKLEKDVVVISAEEYADLVEYRYVFNELLGKHEKLKKVAICNSLNKHRMEREELKNLLNVDSYDFPIENLQLMALLDAGIGIQEIYRLIRVEKNALEEAKKKEEKNDD